jgi:hypothetical protein
MLQGAGLLSGLTAFNLLLRAPNIQVPAWVWPIFFAVVAVIGAGTGAVYYATDGLRAAGGWRKTVGNVTTLLSYALTVLGLLLVGLALLD